MKKCAPILSILLFFTACSLKYGVNYQDESNVPEFVFTDAKYTRYEDKKKSMSLSASRLEQYSDGSSMYAKDVEFQVLDSDGEITTRGECSLLSSNSKEELYVLYDNIKIENKKDDMTVEADSLKWNSKTEQLSSSRNDMVSIKKGKTVMMGSGFSASGVSKMFSFNGVVTGQYDSDEKSDGSSETIGEQKDEQKN